ncbi:hypothetical protein BJX99DRAFT_234065 [Aspergillus californicus]
MSSYNRMRTAVFVLQIPLMYFVLFNFLYLSLLSYHYIILRSSISHRLHYPHGSPFHLPPFLAANYYLLDRTILAEAETFRLLS